MDAHKDCCLEMETDDKTKRYFTGKGRKTNVPGITGNKNHSQNLTERVPS